MIPVENKKFHPLVYSNPETTITEFSKKQSNAYLIEKISYAALTAIGIGVLATFLTVPLTGAVPYVLGGLILSTPVIGYIASSFSNQQKNYASLLDHERKVHEELKQISEWTKQEFANFFKTYHISAPSESHTHKLKPLIARFLTNLKEALEFKALAETLLKAEDIEDRTIRLQSRSIGWQILEESAVPKMLNATLIAEILAHPTMQSEWTDLAAFDIKSFAERQFDRLHGPNDNYLVFHNQNKKPITLKDIETHFSVDDLRKLCF